MIQRLVTALVGLTSSTAAMAHEGHGFDANALLHYFSPEHMILPLGVVVIVATGTLLALRLKKQKHD